MVLSDTKTHNFLQLSFSNLWKRLLSLSTATLFDVLLTLTAIVPHLAHLPAWVSLVAVMVAALCFWVSQLENQRLRQYVVAGVSLCALLLAWYGFDKKFSGDTTLAFLIWALILKRAETTSDRDRLFNVFGALLLAASIPLYFDNFTGIGLVMLNSLVFFLSLYAIRMPKLELRSVLMDVISKWMLALPLAMVMFVFFPRIPGPLWDIGLAMGLPIRAEVQKKLEGMGLDDTLSFTSRPQQNSQASNDNSTVLVVKFDSYVPSTASLYWRGPVFWRFDGDAWHQEHERFSRGAMMREAYGSGQNLTARLSEKTQLLRYKVRVMPHHKYWLYGLDLPAINPTESFISRDFQLLSIRPIRTEQVFDGGAWINYKSLDKPNQTQMHLGLQLPMESNPRLIALGREIAVQAKNPEELVQLISVKFASSGLQVANANPMLSGKNALDTLFFETKAVHPAQLASAFTIAMRAAGVPTRLVSGFRGGRVMALTSYLVVKQSDAHVWTEAWLPNSGWTRFDPVDLLASQTGQPVPKLNVPEKTQPAPRLAEASKHSVVERILDKSQSDGKVILGTFNQLLSKWILHFDAARQVDILAKFGVSKADWRLVMLVLVLIVGLVVGGVLTVAWWVARRQQDVLSLAWAHIEHELSIVGIKRSSTECVTHYALRISQTWPELSARLNPLVTQYITLRYRKSFMSPMAINTRASTPTESAIAEFCRNAKQFRV